MLERCSPYLNIGKIQNPNRHIVQATVLWEVLTQ